MVLQSRKRQRHDQRTGPSVKFRGVLPQPNGNWGAQIYANHQRIWLGTFRTETEAAMAYDSASIKLRRGDTQRNFPVTQYTCLEPTFQDNFTEEEILDRIKDGTYQSKFRDFIRNLSGNQGKTKDALCHPQRRMNSNSGQISCRQLFHKELTPSDVGKLNRLVIPKKYAVKHFPCIMESRNGHEGRENYVDDTELVFHDRLMKVWKFRYCYWKSSQSFVFTRGWNQFVREKELRAKDVVTFYTCTYVNRAEKEADAFLLIDVNYFEGECNDNGMEPPLQNKEELELKLGKGCSLGVYDNEEAEEEECKEEENGVRLFGVQIN
ncbi:hypothetical protein CDL15_Pgr026536 [Punica granatum]|nr:hypothetical protein CDL15_Pgr026536 [Punica granatum]